MKVIRGNKTIYESYSNLDDDTKKALVSAGITTGSAAASALVAKAAAGKQGLAGDIKAACGRKPLFGKDKKAKYQACVNQFTQQQAAKNAPAPIVNAPASAPKKQGMSDTVKYGLIGGGVLVLLLGVYFISKRSNG